MIYLYRYLFSLSFAHFFFVEHFKIVLHLIFINFLLHAKWKLLWNEREGWTENIKEEPEYRCLSSIEKKLDSEPDICSQHSYERIETM